MMRSNPMDRNTGGLGFNKNIAQMHAMLDKMPDSYLTQLVESKDPRATLALMVMGTRQEARKKITETPTSSVAEKVTSEVNGLPSVAPQQNNQDPRLMAGMGGMNANPVAERNSVDTPMTGVAQLPAQQMMADGGIVGYAKGGETEPAEFFGDDSDKLQWIKENPGLAASYGLLAVPGFGVAGAGLRGLGSVAKSLGPKIAKGAKELFTRPGERKLAGFQAYKEGPRTLRKGRIAGTLGTAGLIGSGFGDDEAPATMQEEQVAASPVNTKAETATSNMFDDAISGITSGDMTRFGLNMAAQASKGGSGLTAIAGGAAETRKQVDAIENSSLDREFKQKYYDALANGQISKNVNTLFEQMISGGGLRKATAELVAQGYTEADARTKAGQTLFAAASRAVANASATGAMYPQGSNKGEWNIVEKPPAASVAP
jgi:hypothetical protein